MPERTSEEQAVCRATCKACEEYSPRVEAEGWPPVCLRGCTGELKRRENRPLLLLLWRMATAHCMAGQW